MEERVVSLEARVGRLEARQAAIDAVIGFARWGGPIVVAAVGILIGRLA